MDKVKLEFKAPDNETIEYKGVKFEITPFLSLPQQVVLINQYLKDYFTPSGSTLILTSNYNLLEAEINLKSYILQQNTNVLAEELDPYLYSDSNLWSSIYSKILNYWEFRDMLAEIIDGIKEQKTLEYSTGKVLSNLIDKAYEILNKISDISPEEIDKLQKAGQDLVKKLEESSVLGNNYHTTSASEKVKRTRKKVAK